MSEREREREVTDEAGRAEAWIMAEAWQSDAQGLGVKGLALSSTGPGNRATATAASLCHLYATCTNTVSNHCPLRDIPSCSSKTLLCRSTPATSLATTLGLFLDILDCGPARYIGQTLVLQSLSLRVEVRVVPSAVGGRNDRPGAYRRQRQPSDGGLR